MFGVVMGLGACGQTVAPPPPGSRNYYVDGAAGNDAAAGDSAHPFKTIQHAANPVNPGDVVLEQNLVHDIGRDSLGQNGCNPGNDYWQNHDHGIYLSSGTNAVIRNNVFYNITRGWAIQCFPGPLSQTYIANNTFAFPNPHRDGQIIVAATLTTGAIVNNVFYQPQTAGVLFEGATTSNVVVQYNLTMGGTATTGSGAGVTMSHNLDNKI